MQLGATLKGSLKCEEARELGGGSSTADRRILVPDGSVEVLVLYLYIDRICGFHRAACTRTHFCRVLLQTHVHGDAHTQICARTELLGHNPPESAKRFGSVQFR